MYARETYNAWLAYEGLDGATRNELLLIANDAKEIEDRFFTELSFGTAGLRGVLGAGTNRMNAYTVRRAAQGVADYLLGVRDAAERGVAIAYDSRRMSQTFALETAKVLCANGIKAYLFDGLRAVPQLSFALQHLGCIGGVVITASHNPSRYNGFKVYWEHGGQIGPEQANAITAMIRARDVFTGVKVMDDMTAIAQGLLSIVGAAVDEAYYAATESLSLRKDVCAKAGCSIVYTPLFGAGSRPVQRILADIGVKKLYIVKEQEEPDPDFPGLSAPNPENRDTFELAFKLANEKGVDLILATDPDSDRLGVAARDSGGSFVILSGNQIGCLMLEYLLEAKSEMGRLPKNALVVRSIVSTNLADAICAGYGVQCDEVLTGFRFIAEKIAENDKNHKHEFLFGFEESYGFLLGTYARDKDAIGAAMLLAEAASYYALQGLTLYAQLGRLFEKYGFYAESVRNYTLYGKEGMEKIAAAMSDMRKEPFQTLGGIEVAAVRDYQARKRMASGIVENIILPQSDVLYFELADGSWACVRPSGTEPKLKLYACGNAGTKDAVNEKLAKVVADIESRLKRLGITAN